MRLSNWCVLFLALFLIASLVPNLREAYNRQAFFTTTQYNRNVDRATEDALLTSVEREEVDGSLQIASDKVEKKFLEQIGLQFEAGNLLENILYSKVVNEAVDLSLEEERRLREEMEETVNANSSFNHAQYVFLFPEQEASATSQPLQNHSYYKFIELPDGENYGWSQLFYREPVRFWFSGAKVQKKMTP